ncbi:hypothetical protein BJ138DRAFT_162534 [Hygrophoropsis aurantiaca]|uniref:Uncharacterized protein n=1 Tax=Hygrophoropsis aurantiaca TaxID=72124 RepID=A0ACB8AA51_9AGAM|nr:hypothetical protein BJ138DRAFT_162534 [Hygrophoropsis aurantiaca]
MQEHAAHDDVHNAIAQASDYELGDVAPYGHIADPTGGQGYPQGPVLVSSDYFLEVQSISAQPNPYAWQSENTEPRSDLVLYNGMWIDRVDLETGINVHHGIIYVYQCRWDIGGSPCDMFIESDKRQLNNHLRRWHGVVLSDKVQIRCLWDNCQKSMKTESLARHISGKSHLNVHWKCPGYSTMVCRKDAFKRHTRRKPSCQPQPEVGNAMPYRIIGPQAREINVRSFCYPYSDFQYTHPYAP